MIRHALPWDRKRVPIGAFWCVEPIGQVGHPEITPAIVLIDQPYTTTVALAFFDQCLREHSEEALDVGLPHQQIERELDNIRLDFRNAFGAATFGTLANQGRAKHLGIA